MSLNFKFTIISNIPALLQEAKAKPIDLMRAGLAQGTAYKLSRGETGGMDFDTMATVIGFFRERLERDITPGDILQVKRVA